MKRTSSNVKALLAMTSMLSDRAGARTYKIWERGTYETRNLQGIADSQAVFINQTSHHLRVMCS